MNLDELPRWSSDDLAAPVPWWGTGWIAWGESWWSVHLTPPFKANARRYGR